jgi:hypothetical protein
MPQQGLQPPTMPQQGQQPPTMLIGTAQSLAKVWVRFQLQAVSAITVSVLLIALGLSDSPHIPPVAQLVASHPIITIELAVALLVVSVLAFVVSRLPARSSGGNTPRFGGMQQGMQQGAVPVVAYGPPAGYPPRPGMPAPPSQPLPGSMSRPLPGPMSQPLPGPMSQPLPGPMSRPLPPGMPAGPSQPLPSPLLSTPSLPLGAATPRHNRLALVAILVLIVISLGITGVSVGLIANSTNALQQEPLTTVQAFCAALKQQDYVGAYRFLAGAYQAQTSQDTFKQDSDLQDYVDGPVQECTPSASGSSVNVGQGSASTVTRITRGLAGQQPRSVNGDVTLVREENSWRINGLNSLSGTNVTPLAVAVNFCQAMVDRNYGAAYQATSKSYKDTKGTKDHWIKGFVDIGGGNTNDYGVARCNTNYQSYKQDSADHAQVIITMTLAAFDDKSGQIVDSVDYVNQVTLVHENNQWAVDDIEDTQSSH